MDLIVPSSPTSIFVPCVTAEVFSRLTGLPIGVVEAQLDRRILPVLRLGKRRLVNVEALRQMAAGPEVLPAARPQRSEDGPPAKPQVKARRAGDVPSNTVTNGSQASLIP